VVQWESLDKAQAWWNSQATKDCGIVVVAATTLMDRFVFWVNMTSPTSGPARKWHSNIGCDAIALRRNGKKLSNAALGLDLVGSDPHFQFGRIAAVSFARRVLREVAKQPRIFVAQRSVVGPRAACYGKDADYYGKDEESRRITAFIANWREAALCHHLSPVHSTGGE